MAVALKGGKTRGSRGMLVLEQRSGHTRETPKPPERSPSPTMMPVVP